MSINKYDQIIKRFNIVDGDYRIFENHFIGGRQITFGWPKDYCSDQRVWIGIDSEEEKRVTKSEAERLASGKISIRQLNSSPLQLAYSNNSRQGFCIRCGKHIDYNTEKPYCYDCYKVWNQFSNEEYQENYCHKKGEKHRTSMARPECKTCYYE